MKIVFCGGGVFARMVMEDLVADLDIALIISPPPKPQGRKLQIQPCAAAAMARQLQLPLLETTDMDEAAVQMKDAKADAIVVADYGLILSPAALQASPRGAINIHPSLLPRWRGAAPIARAILAGDKETGVCIMQMDEGLDSGAILMRETIKMPEDKNHAELSAQLATLGATLTIKTLTTNPNPVPQNKDGITYAKKLSKAENIIDYNTPAQTIANQIRAFAPDRAARTIINGKGIGILKGAAMDDDDESKDKKNGTIIKADNNGIVIKCAQGLIIFTHLRREGKTPQGVAEFLRGFPITIGNYAQVLNG